MKDMKNAIMSVNTRLDQAEGKKICELKGKLFDIIQSEEKKKKKMN